jgi:hypothetical protein
MSRTAAAGGSLVALGVLGDLLDLEARPHSD